MKDQSKKYLRDLVKVNRRAIAVLDKIMKEKSSEGRGQKVAKVTNFMELNTDIAARYGLSEMLKGEK